MSLLPRPGSAIGSPFLGFAGRRPGHLAFASCDTPAVPTTPRRRWPRWLTTQSSERAAAIIVVALTLSLLIFSQVLNRDERPLTFILDFAMTAFTILLLVYPVPGAIGVGLTVSLWSFVPSLLPTPTVMDIFVAMFLLSIRGNSWFRNLMAAWYLVAVLIPTSMHSPTGADRLANGVFFAFLTVIALALGASFRQLTDQMFELEEARRNAVADERRLIAQDLHDAVSSATTRIIMRAEQARLRGITDPDVAADVDYIVTTGRQSAADLRIMLTTLRSNAGDATVPASGWRIASLADALAASADELRRSGFLLNTTIQVDDTLLSQMVRDTAGKVVHEATANIVKHAEPGSPCTMLVEQTDDELEMVVVNRRRADSLKGHGTGLGLIGATERVKTLGGEVETNATATDWVLRARIPIH